jgi:hypothetical protein
MLISQPGSDYQRTQITLDAGRARDITCLLPDIHAVLDQLHLDGTQPEITRTAEAVLRESGSPYTLPSLLSALDEVISQLTRDPTRHRRHQPAHPPGPRHLLTGGARSGCYDPDALTPGWGQIKVLRWVHIRLTKPCWPT